ncbi:branched-chain amino acid transport system II carrier protein [Shewanella violacea]|uniref:Branched-chain amino acid transport system carrier protein n=1 Tax=Shewanella violacea (strain JCM 10179 / CIP 106290 / LMG 19151 / DSS12) TaxID=637905 RepID=D4ZH92_SHEVD|nr:branched-chain amino acid transport system II carrier protein [Shewanella violacea]BAJ01041.1 branched-chain amino acid transport system II carrier protein BrnQ [Shewanella violacea DSS12]
MKTLDILAIGLMTFALFLGAGNLIFPPLLGLEAGTQLVPAMVGFLLTSVGLPAFTLIVLGKIGSSQHLTRPLPGWLAGAFWVLLFTVIGPAFGMPRAVTVAYEMGVKPFVTGDHLMLFSVVFSALTLVLAFQPGRLVDYIGKVMTPVLILMLLILAFVAFVYPPGVPQVPTADYLTLPVTHGLIQGYMTMDAIAAVGFGWVIIRAIEAKGCGSRDEVAKVAFKVACIYAVLMSACYIAMGYVGATSATVAAGATNGGEILVHYIQNQFGVYGQWLLAAIIIMACLTTTVGLTNASAEYYKQAFGVSFPVVAVIVVVLTGCIANFGLEQILAVSLPVILILCPVAIALVMASLVLPNKQSVSFTFVSVFLIALIFGSLDGINILGKMPEVLQQSLQNYIPLYDAHGSWFLPCLLVIIISLAQSTKLRWSQKQRACVEPVD